MSLGLSWPFVLSWLCGSPGLLCSPSFVALLAFCLCGQLAFAWGSPGLGASVGSYLCGPVAAFGLAASGLGAAYGLGNLLDFLGLKKYHVLLFAVLSLYSGTDFAGFYSPWP